jgi:ketosteroid isomerase-like protein
MLRDVQLRDTPSMASANLDLVRSIYAEGGGAHFISYWAQSNRIAEWAHPDIEFVVADGPTAGSFRGVAAMEQSARSMLGAWEDYRSEVEEWRELDSERVLVLERRSGRGKMSGLEVGTKGAMVVHVRDGRVTRLIVYYDRECALADLGLAPEAKSPGRTAD